MAGMARKPYPSDVSDEEWAFAAPYLTLMDESAPQREHALREVFNGLRWVVRTGSPWRYMPHDLPPWAAVYQPTRCWKNGPPATSPKTPRMPPYQCSARMAFRPAMSLLSCGPHVSKAG